MDDRALPSPDDVDRTHPGYARWRGVIPLPNERMMLHVGAETVENFFVVADAWAQTLCARINTGDRVLDLGCGCGRTARLLVNDGRIAAYLGLDVVEPFVAWCTRHITAAHPRFEFAHLDVATPRYNPEGTMPATGASLPVPDDAFDLVFAASLYTHLRPDGARRYLEETARVLRSGGTAVVSFHDRPAGGADFSGDEFRADYALDLFVGLCAEGGFRVTENLGDLCGQTALVLAAPG